MNASFEMNEPDRIASRRRCASRSRHGGEVVVCSAGPARVDRTGD